MPVAAAMLSAVDDYFDKLRDFRRGDLDSITDYVESFTKSPAAAETESGSRPT